ncbi:hypothetical protein OIO90_003236 [Microbotryomycetes sp. JL221]|nr:hypothetical protein OIO90_003236 [Microbotryomycetes sp. JL221]
MLSSLVQLLALSAIITPSFAFPAFANSRFDKDFLKARSPANTFDTNVTKRQTGSDPFLNLPTLTIPGILAPVQVIYPGSPTSGRVEIPDSSHPYQDPPSGAQRGACPGLNILANYGYISRSGITNVGELLFAMQQVFGFAPDLAGVLTAFTLKGMTDPTTLRLSIGGTDSRTSGLLSFLLGGQVPGLFAKESHNKYERDGSFAHTDSFFRPDGTTRTFNATNWAKRVTTANSFSSGLFGPTWNGQARFEQYNECIATNPQCSWLVVSQILFYGAGHLPWATMMSTGPDGLQEPATQAKIQTAFGISQQGSTFVKVPEQLPPSSDGKWYRRATGYTVAEVVQGAIDSFLMHPVAFGANSGSTNSFIVQGTQLDADNISVQSVGCLLVAEASENIPVSLLSIQNDLLALLGALVAPAKASLACA